MKKIAVALYLILLSQLVTSCTFDEIEISMMLRVIGPVFQFKYVKRPDIQVEIFSIRVYESTDEDTLDQPRKGPLVWEIRSYDPALIFEKRGDKIVLKKLSHEEYEKLKSIKLSELTFGDVPGGFEQYYPINNEKPVLKPNIKYIIIALSGAGEGMTEFTVERECRKISRTHFSGGHPGFDEKFYRKDACAEISVTPRNTSPIFHFGYVDRPDKIVPLSSIRVYESLYDPDTKHFAWPRTEQLVWEIWSYDPALIFEKKGSLTVLRKHSLEEWEDIEKGIKKSVELSEVTFGAIPEGFKQFYPKNSEKPVLKRTVRYVITTGGSMTEFTVDRECRKILGTPFTRDIPAFSTKDNCLAG